MEGALVKAQSAVLNPSKRWKDFAQKVEVGGGSGAGAGVEDFEVKFSPNVVCLGVRIIRGD